MATSRTIAVGDIHGCLEPFERLMAAIQPAADDKLVILGDVIDRGPQSRGVIERLLKLREQCQLICLMGNHEEMLLAAIDGVIPLQQWLQHGGAETLDSYGKGSVPAQLPLEHINFIRSWGDYYETPAHFYAHGNYLAASRSLNSPGTKCVGSRCAILCRRCTARARQRFWATRQISKARSQTWGILFALIPMPTVAAGSRRDNQTQTKSGRRTSVVSTAKGNCRCRSERASGIAETKKAQGSLPGPSSVVTPSTK